jgi:hypothetical protein
MPNAVLEGVAVAPGGDVWAVGDELASSRSLILRWHGGSVERVASPSFPDQPEGELRAVVAPARDEVWAVGIPGILRWDGQRWRRVSAPKGSYLGVAASSPDDAWAVGVSSVDERFLVSHWDGSRWRRVPFLPIAAQKSSGSLVTFGYLYDVLDLSKTDVWVVGGTPNDFAFTARWDGKEWQRYKVGGKFTRLHSLAAVSENDIWAAGEYVAEWDGQHWVLRGRYYRPAVDDIVVRDGEVWAATDDARTINPYAVARWTGARWVALEPRSADAAINGLAVASNGDVWAVGQRVGGHVSQRVIFKRYRCPP